MAINIDYSTIDFDALKAELINYLQETNTYKDVNFDGSNINTLVGLYAYLGSLFGYYINSTANEPFLPSAKRYKNLNRIAKLLAYNPRGNKSASASIVGSLLPEYCLGKEDAFFELPSYSLFPVNKPTPDGVNFSFTNINPLVYLIRSFGVRTVEQTDFTYNGLPLPLTKPVDYWLDSNNVATFEPTSIELNLSDTLPLSVLNRLDPSNYKGYDQNVPLFDGADSSSVGQPFNRNIAIRDTPLAMLPGNIYFIVFNYDSQTSTPYLSILEEGTVLESRKDDVITSIRLEPTDASETFYTLKEIQNNSKGRFYVGVLGMENLEAVSFAFDKLESTVNGIKQVHIDINKSGDKPPFRVLVEGVTYTFSSGRISSQIFPANSWDMTQPSYNVNLTIVTPDSPESNYDATLTVTSKAPGVNEVTIAQIYPQFTDPETNIIALKKDAGQRFGNLQSVPDENVLTTEQKSGSVNFVNGITTMYISFDIPFVKATVNDTIDYIIQLTPSDNVQVWFSDKSEKGFAINVEEDTGFTGNVDWVATRVIDDATRQMDVSFDSPIPQINGSDADYTVFLTASDNVNVWYTDKTSKGFKINTEKQFNGTISYSTFVFSNDAEVLKESSLATLKKGTVTFTPSLLTRDITFDTAFNDNNYGLHMIANQNINVWYTNKTTTGFTINIESDFLDQVTVDWYADESALYQFQKHGMVAFTGQVTNAGTLPGLRFINVPETFQLDNLKDGSVKFSHINRNGALDATNNYLGLQFSANRKSVDEIKLQVTADNISYADIRVFVKNTADEWEEWQEASTLTTSTDISVGEKVFFVRVDEYQFIEISFGNGDTFGVDPTGSEIIIFGLQTVGQYGNVPPNTIGPSVVLSKNILGDDDISVTFESQFIQLLGLKSQVYFAANEQTNLTSIYDSEGTKITDKELTIEQPVPAFGGAFAETTEELRSNAGTANLRQDRVVSKDDYQSFCRQAFSDYIIKTQVLSFQDIQTAGILAPGDLSKYWFNYIFIVALPKYGNAIPKTHRDYILSTLDQNFKAMATVEHELISATLVPIDIRIRMKRGKVGSSESIQTTAKKLIRDFFNSDNHEMGETIEYGMIEKILLDIPNVENAELAFNRNDGNKLTESDYISEGVTSASETVQQVKVRKVLELLAKDPSLLNIVDPLFDIKDSTTGETSWVFSQNLTLGTFEFPILGDIIIEMEN